MITLTATEVQGGRAWREPAVARARPRERAPRPAGPGATSKCSPAAGVGAQAIYGDVLAWR